MDNQAIRPSFYADFTTKVDNVSETKVDEDQKALAYITHFRGWVLVREHVDALNRFLDDALQSAIGSGADIKEIGERALVKEMTKYVLKSLVDKVENARKSEDK